MYDYNSVLYIMVKIYFSQNHGWFVSVQLSFHEHAVDLQYVQVNFSEICSYEMNWMFTFTFRFFIWNPYAKIATLVSCSNSDLFYFLFFLFFYYFFILPHLKCNGGKIMNLLERDWLCTLSKIYNEKYYNQTWNVHFWNC